MRRSMGLERNNRNSVVGPWHVPFFCTASHYSCAGGASVVPIGTFDSIDSSALWRLLWCASSGGGGKMIDVGVFAPVLLLGGAAEDSEAEAEVSRSFMYSSTVI